MSNVWGAQTAGETGRPMYHASPPGARLDRGLDWKQRDRTRDWREPGDEELYPHANYLTSDKQLAEQYAQEMNGGPGWVWEVDPNGLDLQRDVDEDWNGSSWYTSQPIGPERVKRLAASPDELHVSLDIPRHAAKAIFRWAREQRWPDGTQLEDPKDYHITLLYTPQGRSQWGDDAWWLQNKFEHGQARINIVGLDSFPARHKDEGGYAYVLRVDCPTIQEAAEQIQHRAEMMGLPITHFPGGYKPHITIGYGPVETSGVEAPTYSFDVGPSSISEPRESAFNPATGVHQVQAPVHTLKVKSPTGTRHIRRCNGCGVAYEHKPKTHHTCPTCGASVVKGHHH